MCSVFDHAQAMLAGNPIQSVHIHGQTGEMYRHDGTRLVGDRCRDQFHI